MNGQGQDSIRATDTTLRLERTVAAGAWDAMSSGEPATVRLSNDEANRWRRQRTRCMFREGVWLSGSVSPRCCHLPPCGRRAATPSLRPLATFLARLAPASPAPRPRAHPSSLATTLRALRDFPSREPLPLMRHSLGLWDTTGPRSSLGPSCSRPQPQHDVQLRASHHITWDVEHKRSPEQSRKYAR